MRALLLLAAFALPASASEFKRDTRYVVFHLRGPSWKPGLSLREQPFIREHVEHYRKLLEQGKLELGGPFIDEKDLSQAVFPSAGMMIPAAGVSREETERFAAEDPAVKEGVLKVEISALVIGMKKP